MILKSVLPAIQVKITTFVDNIRSGENLADSARDSRAPRIDNATRHWQATDVGLMYTTFVNENMHDVLNKNRNYLIRTPYS